MYRNKRNLTRNQVRRRLPVSLSARRVVLRGLTALGDKNQGQIRPKDVLATQRHAAKRKCIATAIVSSRGVADMLLLFLSCPLSLSLLLIHVQRAGLYGRLSSRQHRSARSSSTPA